MTLYINGKLSTVQNGMSVSELMQQMQLTDKRIAVELNQQIISRSAYDKHFLKNNDKIEIVNAIGGG